MKIITDLWVCQDCLFALANGDYPDDPAAAKAITDGETREAPYHWTLDGDRDGEPEGSSTSDFSWRPCACCQSRLGGSRHRAALISEEVALDGSPRWEARIVTYWNGWAVPAVTKETRDAIAAWIESTPDHGEVPAEIRAVELDAAHGLYVLNLGLTFSRVDPSAE